jgi:hypothetical protein
MTLLWGFCIFYLSMYIFFKEDLYTCFLESLNYVEITCKLTNVSFFIYSEESYKYHIIIIDLVVFISLPGFSFHVKGHLPCASGQVEAFIDYLPHHHAPKLAHVLC